MSAYRTTHRWRPDLTPRLPRTPRNQVLHPVSRSTGSEDPPPTGSPAAIPSASTAMSRAESASGSRNVAVQVSPCQKLTTVMPSVSWVETAIRRAGVRTS